MIKGVNPYMASIGRSNMSFIKSTKRFSGRPSPQKSNESIILKYRKYSGARRMQKAYNVSHQAIVELTKNDIMNAIGKDATNILSLLTSRKSSNAGYDSRKSRIKICKFALTIPKIKNISKKSAYIPPALNISFKKSISKIKHIQTYYSNFMGNVDTLCRGKYIPLTPHSQVSEADPVNYTTFRKGIDLKIAKKCLIYLCLNIGVTTQTILGFVICKNLWDESISNDSNYLCSKPSHIIKCLNIGGSYGYIS